MTRIHALAGAVLAVLALALGVAQAAADHPARSHETLPASSFEPRGVTPPAKPGSTLAAKRAISGHSLRKKLAARMRAAGGQSGAWVYDINAGRTLFKDHASKRRILASNTKLFTTTALLGRYGANHEFKTRIWLRGHRGGHGNHTLHGSVALVGAGDPALASSSFARDNGLPVTAWGSSPSA